MQVIRNLLNNSFSYSNKKSKIVVRIKEQQESILLSILDTGLGIPENELEIIFEKFTQSNKNGDGFGGRGLRKKKKIGQILVEKGYMIKEQLLKELQNQ